MINYDEINRLAKERGKRVADLVALAICNDMLESRGDGSAL
jgi:hypothetical protein